MRSLSLLVIVCMVVLCEVGFEAQGAAKKDQQFMTFLEDAGWCWYQDPRAIIHNGKLVIAGVSGVSGDVRLSVYDLAKKKSLGTITLFEGYERDDHAAPAFYARPDGRLLIVYSRHGGTPHHYHISDKDDYLKWGPRQEYLHPRSTSYMNLHYMEDEGLLYNFFREGATFNPHFITSTDQGETWGNETHLIMDEVEGRQRPYVRYLQRDANTVGLSFTEGHPRNFGNSIYYADFRGRAFYNADGTKIKDLAEGPLMPSEAEQIFKGSGALQKPTGYESMPLSAWTCAIEKDAQNRPSLGYSLYLNNDDHRYRLATWRDNKWVDREIAFAGGCLYTRESSYTGLFAMDPLDPTWVFISSDVNPSTGEDLGGKHEIYGSRVGAKDDVSTIKWKPISWGSEVRNIRPKIITGDGYKVLLWLRGPWTYFTKYESDIVGIVLDRP